MVGKLRLYNDNRTKLRELYYDDTKGIGMRDEVGNEYDIVRGAYDYIIYGEDIDGDGIVDVVYAKNGRTGKIEFEGETISYILDKIFNVSEKINILLRDGVYVADSTINISNKNTVHIEGVGDVRIEWRGSMDDLKIVRVEDVDKFIIRNIVFANVPQWGVSIGPASTSKGKYAIVDGVRVYGSGYYTLGTALSIWNYENIIVNNCYVYGMDDVIQIKSTSRKISNVYIIDNVFVDGRVEVGLSEIDIDNVFVANNVFVSDSEPTYLRLEPKLGNVVVSSNIFVAVNETHSYAVRVERNGVNGEISNINISGNVIDTYYLPALYINVEDGMSVGTVKFSDNIISGVVETGMIHVENYGTFDTLEIVNNIFNYSDSIYNPSVKIYGDNPIRFVKICDNKFKCTSSYVNIFDRIINIPEFLFLCRNIVESFDGEIFRTENSGTTTFSGDGTTTQFVIAHGLVSMPSKVQVTPMSADAVGPFYVTADETNIYVNYTTAPPSGTNNIKLSWYAEV